MRAERSAYDVASQEAWKIRNSIVEAIEEAIRSGEVTDEESLSERAHEEIDNALIYTADAWVCAYGLRQTRDPFSEGLLDSPESIEQVITLQAYLNLEDSINLGDFEEALTVARDSREERG